MLLSGIPAVLSAQADVPVAAGGIASLTGSAPIYNGQYVLKQTDFGFLWLDTVALTGGLVQVEAKCAVGQPVPVTNLYVIGDCNGITDIKSTGNVVLARQLSGQCGAAKRGCNGPRDDGHTYFVFALGTWALITDNGTGTEAGDSTQTSDPLGRTWTAIQIDLAHFAWHVTGGPTIPVAQASYRNLTTTGGANFLGDKFQFTDTSATATQIVHVDWDVNAIGGFAPDASVGTTTSLTGYLPCDPASGGAFASGGGCAASVGAPVTTAAWAQRFSEQSRNTAGYTSQNVFTSPAIQFVCASISIVGYSGASGSCAQTGGTLGVLSGGNADASATQGNIDDPTTSFAWTFAPGGAASGKVVPVPATAQNFSLTVTYPGGWQSTATGSVTQTDLVPAFSISPTLVVVGEPIHLTNQMQIGPAATLRSVDYRVLQGVPVASGTLASSFLTVGGTAAVTAPGSPAGDCILELTYHFDGPTGGAGQSAVVTRPFATFEWSSSPAIAINPVPLCLGFGCQLSTGTAYALSDNETIPPGITHPAALWELVNGGTTTTIGTSSDCSNPVSWTPATACSSCTLRVTVAGVASTLPIVIASVTPPPTGNFFTLDPCRVADTRAPVGPYGGPSVVGGNERTFVLSGRCGIPAEARAVAVTLTVTNTNAAGDVRVFPAGVALPLVSTLNWRTGQTRSGSAIVPVGSGGAITVHLDQSPFGTSDVIIDVFGWFN